MISTFIQKLLDTHFRMRQKQLQETKIPMFAKSCQKGNKSKIQVNRRLLIQVQFLLEITDKPDLIKKGYEWLKWTREGAKNKANKNPWLALFCRVFVSIDNLRLKYLEGGIPRLRPNEFVVTSCYWPGSNALLT